MDILAAIQQMLQPVKNRMALMISRAVLSSLADGEGLQLVQVKVRGDDDVHDRAERYQNYGLTTVPLAGAECIVVAVGGITSHLAILGIDDRRHRPKNLKAGEVMLYDHLGQYFHFKEDGSWELNAVTAGKIVAPAGLEIDAPFLHCTGEIKDRVATGGKSMSEMRGIFDGHDHGGIEPGAGTTADPNQAMGGH